MVFNLFRGCSRDEKPPDWGIHWTGRRRVAIEAAQPDGVILQANIPEDLVLFYTDDMFEDEYIVYPTSSIIPTIIPL